MTYDKAGKPDRPVFRCITQRREPKYSADEFR
jgi:hypothetical protein